MVPQTRTHLPVLLTLLFVFTTIGCHRGFYRRQADAEAARLIEEKTNDSRWQSSSGDISIDPQSRMFDPFSQDHPPMPKDDPASHQFLHTVDGRPGYPQWHANGDTNYAENPDWLAYLPTNEKGEVVISLERAVDLAYLHSSVYQQQKETLYLSALDVSIERFDFDSQLNWGWNTLFNTQGRLAPGGSSSTLSQTLGFQGEGINWQKMGITGTNFAVGLANTILWNFAGPDNETSTSLINFSIIQPFLRGAGREVILEQLTQSERTLLANVRQMDRFRRGFYMLVSVGRAPGQGPGGNFLTEPTGAAGPGGFIGLLQQRQQIRNQEFAVRQFENVLSQFRELFQRDRIDSLQKVQVESQLYGSQQALLTLRQNYLDSLDLFKETLGIPPHIKVVIDDSYLDRFELISNGINQRQVELDLLRNETGSALVRLGEALPEVAPLTEKELGEMEEFRRRSYQRALERGGNQDFSSDPDLDQRVAAILPFAERAMQTIKQIQSLDLDEIEDDFRKLESARPERIQYLKELRDFIDSGRLRELGEIERSLLSSESIASLQDSRDERGGGKTGLATQLKNTMKKVAEVERSLQKTLDQITQFPELRKNLNDKELFELIQGGIIRAVPKQLTELYNNVLELSLIQAQARANSISLSRIDLDAATSLEIARCFRLDWMNARAALVDSWRQIEFSANQLESELDLEFSGSIGNFGGNSFNFRSDTGTLSAGLSFDSPLVRQVERNDYRETLIQYQQARRSYYLFEDEVNRNLRASLRGIDVNKILFELNRRSVQVQIEQVEQARLRLEEPGQIQTGGRSSFSNTVAQDLLSAIQSLQNVQNQYLNVWVSYEVARRNLDFDLGTMQVDQTGRWLDPGDIDATIGHRVAQRLGLDTSCLDCGLSNIPLAPGSDGSEFSTENRPLSSETDEDSEFTPNDDSETEEVPAQLEWENSPSEPAPDSDFLPPPEPLIERPSFEQ